MKRKIHKYGCKFLDTNKENDCICNLIGKKYEPTEGEMKARVLRQMIYNLEEKLK